MPSAVRRRARAFTRRRARRIHRLIHRLFTLRTAVLARENRPRRARRAARRDASISACPRALEVPVGSARRGALRAHPQGRRGGGPRADAATCPAERLRDVEARGRGRAAARPRPSSSSSSSAPRYYQRPLGEVIAASLPPRLRQVSRRAHRRPPSPQRAGRRGFAAAVDAHAGAAARRVDARSRGRDALPPGAAAGRHRQRQDRGLPARSSPTRSRAAARRCSWCPRSASRRSSRRRCASASPGARLVAAHSHLARGRARARPGSPRSRARAQIVLGTRLAVLHAVPRPGARRRRRGARRLVQAAGGPALLGARRRGAPRAAPRHPGRAGLGHALARELRQRARGPLRARAAARRAPPRARAMPAVRTVDTRADRPQRRPHLRARRGDARAPRARRAVASSS